MNLIQSNLASGELKWLDFMHAVQSFELGLRDISDCGVLPVYRVVPIHLRGHICDASSGIAYLNFFNLCLNAICDDSQSTQGF